MLRRRHVVTSLRHALVLLDRRQLRVSLQLAACRWANDVAGAT